MKKLITLLAIGLIAAPAFAATYDFYGSVRLNSFYGTSDKDLSGLGKSDTDLEFGTQGNSRIGANVKASDKLSATFEFGLGTNEDGKNAVKTRLLYATYDFGAFKMKIGQDYHLQTLNLSAKYMLTTMHLIILVVFQFHQEVK